MEVFDITRKNLESALLGNGFAKFRATQITQWIYQKRVFSFDEMSNISKEDRAKLAELFTITPMQPEEVFTSSDGTQKLAFKLYDGNVVETVIIPEETRCTLCVSTQAGCPLHCAFCRTGSLGFKRDLTVSEITGQVLAAQIASEERGQKITNLVFMGMGEPLLNFKNLLDSIEILLDDFCFNFSNRKITVSTSGVADKIVELGEKTKVNLAVSLHAVTDEKRSKIMPINKKYPLSALLRAIDSYPISRKMVVLEYVMLKNFNDTPEDAEKLAKIAKRYDAKVNLIPFNTFEGTAFEPTPMKKIIDFQNILIAKNVTALIRKSRGGDKLAACGQLGRVKS
ncbi:23S rRNA (adenine(2503)-C(2))-methyltransferase RlmN [bacterium]|nr:23S rRNA (adenine(2503)-C(2))-methyltransferase RlmN [bacterium]